MNKTLPIIIGLILIVAVGGLVFLQNQDNDSDTSVGTIPATSTAQSNTEGKTYAMADVAMHSSATSCWTVIDANVYDLTAWIPQHPGGEQAILSLCGHDGTAAFHGQHDDAKRQADILVSFKIGTLQ